jgi:hypothetical protein
VRRPDDLAAHYSAGIVVVHPLDACLAVHLVGLGRDLTGLLDEREIVARVLERRQDAAHRAQQPVDVLPRVLPVLRQVCRDATVRQVWVVTKQAPLQRVSPVLARTSEPQTEQFRTAQQSVRRWSRVSLQDEWPLALLKAVPYQDEQLPEPLPDLAAQFQTVLPVLAQRLPRVSPQSQQALTARQYPAWAQASCPQPSRTCPLPRLLRRPPRRGNAYARARHASGQSNSSASFFP